MKNFFKMAASVAFAGLSAMSASAQCPGALIVNEVSKGTLTNGSRQFVELIAVGTATGSTQCTDATVDVSGWIIDDNNGIFSQTPAQAGVAISGGHYRLTNDSIWKNISKGSLIVLFDSASYDATLNANFALAANSANGWIYDNTNAYGVYFVALRKGKTPVYRNTTIPTASAPASSLYCGRGSYTKANDWGQASIPAACTGDGIQVRCPGCQGGLGEPAFYHGFSYGSNMFHVGPAQGAGFLEGAHFSFAPTDTICALQGSFFLNSPVNKTDAQLDAAWSYTPAANATPGITNSVLNDAYVINIAFDPTFTYSRCDVPSLPIGGGPGVLMVTEISNGPSSSCEYIELLVANAGSDVSTNVDVRGWIIDDNNGIFNNGTCITGAGIGAGHYRLAKDADPTWANVKVGSFIVLYNMGTTAAPENCYNFPAAYKDSTYADGHHVYFLPISGSGTTYTGTAHVQSISTLPTATTNCTYCTSLPNSYTTAVNWSNAVGLGNTIDGIQVRCPGCNTTNTAQPTFYHGFAYYSTTTPSLTSVPATAGSNLGGPVLNTGGAGSTFAFTGVTTTAIGLSTGWTKTAASVAGSIPATVGNISSAAFYGDVTGHNLNLPSCSGPIGARMANVDNNGGIISGNMTDVSVYPNPATESLNIEFPNETGKVSVVLMDMSGRVVASKEVVNENKVNFDLSGLAPGLYLYQVSTATAAQSGKIAVTK